MLIQPTQKTARLISAVGCLNKNFLMAKNQKAKINKGIIVFVLILFVFALNGCISRQNFHEKVIRTDLSIWKTIQLPQKGISIELPVNEFDFQLHKIKNLMADSIWLLSVSVKKMPEKELLNYRYPSSGNPLRKNKDYIAWLEWSNRIHPQIDKREEGGKREYRRDFITKDDMVVRIHVDYNFKYFTKSERQEDEVAINRIINSLKFIEE